MGKSGQRGAVHAGRCSPPLRSADRVERLSSPAAGGGEWRVGDLREAVRGLFSRGDRGNGRAPGRSGRPAVL